VRADTARVLLNRGIHKSIVHYTDSVSIPLTHNKNPSQRNVAEISQANHTFPWLHIIEKSNVIYGIRTFSLYGKKWLANFYHMNNPLVFQLTDFP